MKCFNTYCASRCRTCHVIYVLRVCRSCASAVRPMGTVPVAKSACCVWGTCGRSAATVWVSTASLSPASRAQGRVHAQQSAWLYLRFKNKRHTCKMPLSNQLDSKAGEKSYTCISWRGSWQESELSWWDWRRIEAVSVPQNSKLRIDFPEIPLLLLLLSTEATQFLIKLDFFSKIFARLFKAIELKT